ncbi:MAG: HEPN domain-containing protein [Betaproteobacteria bacterium]|nr:HEPN domain-containing protein [Betaproteobacteria bacterium]
MTPPREEARRLLRIAQRDRETFDLLLPLPRASLAAIGFLAQQCVEKALKAVAVARGVEVWRTHDLAALGEAIIGDGGALPVTVDDLRGLNPYAVAFRYDDEIVPAITRAELDALLAAVLQWARQCVEE